MKRLGLLLALCVLVSAACLSASAQTGGELLVACDGLFNGSFSGSNVARLNLDGSLRSRINTSFAFQDLEIGPDGRLYVIDPANSAVIAYDLLSPDFGTLYATATGAEFYGFVGIVFAIPAVFLGFQAAQAIARSFALSDASQLAIGAIGAMVIGAMAFFKIMDPDAADKKSRASEPTEA